MKPLVIQQLEAQGIMVSEDKYKEKEELWNFIKNHKKHLSKEDLEESTMALKNIAGGDFID